MLSKEVMGVLALCILWVNTLLIAGAAAQELLSLWRRRRQLRPLAPGEEGAGLFAGRVTRGDGPDGALAVHRVEQVGRAGAGGDRSIVFADRKAEGEVFGGKLSVDGAEIDVDAASPCEVWVDASSVGRAAECASQSMFDDAYESARKARGFSRTVATAIPGEAAVFVFGELRGDGDARKLVPAAEGGLLVTSMDPRGFLARKMALAGLFIAVELVLAAAVTWIALWEPRFGLVSTLGGALCLAFFLAAQPAGTALRDAVRTPNRAIVRGRWAAGAGAGESARPLVV